MKADVYDSLKMRQLLAIAEATIDTPKTREGGFLLSGRKPYNTRYRKWRSEQSYTINVRFPERVYPVEMLKAVRMT